MAAATANYDLTTTWTKVASTPAAVTVVCNGIVPWYLAVTSADTAPTVKGEYHFGREPYIAGSIIGYVWIKLANATLKANFAVTTQ